MNIDYIEQRNNSRKLIIIFHGYGASMHDLAGLYNVIDNATYEEPLLPSSGIEKVFTNGKLVWENLTATENFSGKFLEGKSFN